MLLPIFTVDNVAKSDIMGWEVIEMSLKEKVFDFRARHNLTQAQAAKLMNTSREMIIAIENDKRKPSQFMQRRIEIFIEEYNK